MHVGKSAYQSSYILINLILKNIREYSLYRILQVLRKKMEKRKYYIYLKESNIPKLCNLFIDQEKFIILESEIKLFLYEIIEK